jgi:peptidoglycan/LPS O-acetylase OafA/YrhL
MNYFIITNKKRAIVALVHSIAFLGLAIAMYKPPKSIGFATTASAILTVVYFIVTSILLWLALASRARNEKLYFGLCATSAGFGLLRMVVASPMFAMFAVYVRVSMLAMAVIVGVGLWRTHGRLEASAEAEPLGE